jgi:hypothetical protein
VTTECGHADCFVSTGIHDGLTFGRGDLNDYGYWDEPCSTCARAHEAKHPEDGPCWPFTSKLGSRASGSL